MQSSKKYFKELYTVYIIMLVLPSVSSVIALSYKQYNDFTKHDIPYVIADGIVVLLGFSLAYFYSQKNIKEAKRTRGLNEKLSKYKKVLFIPWFILEAVAIFSIACYLVTGELLFVCNIIFTLVILFLNKPNLSTIAERLNLSEEERRILENPESAI